MLNKPIPLEPEKMVGIGVKRSKDFSFAKAVEVVPIGFTEIVPCSLWYPVFIGLSDAKPMFFVALGAGGKNVFVNSNYTWKVSVIPKILDIYPFGLVKSGEEEYTIVVEEEYLTDKEEPLFNKDGETSYFQNIKAQIEEIAKDLHDASLRAKELLELDLVQPLNLYHKFSFGEMHLQNALSADIRKLFKLQPEKLYYLMSKGILQVLLAQNLSMRNFVLFEVFNKFEGQLTF